MINKLIILAVHVIAIPVITIWIFSDNISAIISGVISSLIVLKLQSISQPKLTMEVGSSDDHSVYKAKLLLISVKNEKLCPLFSIFFERKPALMCEARINFFCWDIKNSCFKPHLEHEDMQGRWKDTPVPFNDSIREEGYNPWLVRNWVDIPADGQAELNVIAKWENDDSCYGWNNDAYKYCHYKNKKWELKPSRKCSDVDVWAVKIVVKTNGREFCELFWLINKVDSLKLEKISDRTDRNKIRCP